MTNARDIGLNALPCPLPPSEAELTAWNAVTRDEQVRRYRDYLTHPDCQRITAASMVDILSVARERVAARRRG